MASTEVVSSQQTNPPSLQTSVRQADNSNWVRKLISVRFWYSILAIGALFIWLALRHACSRYLALTRMSLKAVCRESEKLGAHDYHSYVDDVDEAPWFSEGYGRCRRCGKRFRL